jgi:hypothetical protein
VCKQRFGRRSWIRPALFGSVNRRVGAPTMVRMSEQRERIINRALRECIAEGSEAIA